MAGIRTIIPVAINAAIRLLVRVSLSVLKLWPTVFFKISLICGSRAPKDVDLNPKKLLVEFFIQITKMVVLAGFTSCKALVKFCVAASSQMEEQSTNDAASARISETSVITTMDTTNSEA